MSLVLQRRPFALELFFSVGQMHFNDLTQQTCQTNIANATAILLFRFCQMLVFHYFRFRSVSSSSKKTLRS